MTFTEPDALTISKIRVADNSCYGAADGAFKLVVGGGSKNSDGELIQNYRLRVTCSSSSQTSSSFLQTDYPAAGDEVEYASLAAGTYRISLIDGSTKSGYDESDKYCYATDTIVIHQPEAYVSLSNSNASDDFYACAGDDVDLKLIVSNWNLTQTPLNVVVRRNDIESSDATYIVTKSPYTFTVNNDESTSYRIVNVYTDEAECAKGTWQTDNISIAVKPRPTGNIHGYADICLGASVEATIDLTPTDEPDNVWTLVVSDGSIGERLTISQTPYIYTYTPTSTTEATDSVWLTITSLSDKYCTSIDDDLAGSAHYSVRSVPTVTMTGATTVCSGESATLTFVVEGGTAPYNFNFYSIAQSTSGSVTVQHTVPSTQCEEVEVSEGRSTYAYTIASMEYTTKYYLTGIVDSYGCDPEASYTDVVTINVREQVSRPESIEGESIVCQGSRQSYTTQSVADATGYNWTVPEHASIYTGNGTTNIYVDFDNDFEGGEITVVALNYNCGSSDVVRFVVAANPLPKFDDTVEDSRVVNSYGLTNFCQGQTEIIFSIPEIDNATSYYWEVPTGMTIVYGNGSSAISVSVDADAVAITGVVRVRGVNECGNGEWSDELTVRLKEIPSVRATSDIAYCKSIDGAEGTIEIEALLPAEASNYDYNWQVLYGGSAFDNGTDDGQTYATGVAANVLVSTLTQGSNKYLLTVTDTDTGCAATDTVTINNNTLTVSARAIYESVCDGQTQLQGTNVPSTCSGLWTISTSGDAQLASFDDATIANATVSGLVQGETELVWTITKNSCPSSASCTVVNGETDEPEVTISGGDFVRTVTLGESGYRYVVCGTEVTLVGSTPSTAVLPNQTGTWARVSGGGVFSGGVNERTQNITNLSKGDNKFSYTYSDGTSCSKTVIVNIFNAQLNVTAGYDKATCSNDVTLDATALVDGVTGEWSSDGYKVTFTDSSDPKTTATLGNRGDVVLTWTVTQEGCQSTADVTITNNTVTTSTTQSNDVVCDGSSTLTGSAIDTNYETGKWSIVSGYAYFVDVTDPTTVAYDFERGETKLKWTISSLKGGCQSYSYLTVTNATVDAYAGRDTIICSTQTTLNATVPSSGEGEWAVINNGAATFTNNLSPTTKVGGLTYGTNELVWTVRNSVGQTTCVSYDTVKITNSLPKFIADDESVAVNCTSIDIEDALGTKLCGNYIADGYGTGTWTIKTGGGSIEDVHDAESWVDNLADGTSVFIWTAVNENCSIADSVSVTWGDVRAANAGTDVYNLCSDSYTLTGNGPYNGVGQWSIVYGSGTFADASSAKTKVTGLQQGKNIFRWTISYNSASVYDDVEIWNMTVTTANAGTTRTICSYEYELQGNEQKVGSYTVNKSDGTTEYITCSQVWSVVAGSGTFTDKAGISQQPDTLRNAYVTNLKQGENRFQYTIYNNYCSSTDEVTIVNDMADQAVAYVGNDQDTITTCDGTVRLYPNTPSHGTGEWVLVPGGQATFEDDTYAYNLALGTNYLIWEISTETGGECTTRDTVTVINNTPTTADAGPEQTVCGDEALLTGNKPSAFTEAYWELRSGGGQFVDPDTGELVDRVCLYPSSSNEAQTLTVKGLNFGNNRFRWVIKNEDCVSTAETVLDNIYLQAVAGSLNPTCKDTVTLNANNPSPGTGHWSVVPGYGSASFIDAESYNTKVTGLQSGENLLLWSVNYLECPSYDTLVLVNNKATDAYIEGGTQQLCESNTTMLSASPLATSPDTTVWYETGYWEISDGGGTILSPNSSTTYVTDIPFNANGNAYRWVVTRTYGSVVCISTAQVIVEYNKMEAYAGEEQQLCDDETILQATSSGAATGTWSVAGASSAAVFENEHDPTTKVSSLGLGENILRWTTTYKGCTDYAEVSIINGKPSTPYAGSEQNTCDDYVTLEAHKPDIGTGEWSTVSGLSSWDDASKYDNNATVNLDKGDNTFRWTVYNYTPIYRGIDTETGLAYYDTLTCSLSDDVTIHNQNPSDPYAGTSQAVCEDKYTLKAVDPDYGTGLWTIVNSGGGIIEAPTSSTTKVTSLAYGTTRFRWTVSVDGNCAKYDEVEISNFSPTISDAGPDISDCSSCAALDANTPTIGDGRWEVISGLLNDETGAPSFDNTTEPKTTVCNLLFGENKFLWIIENIATYDGSTYRCESVDTVSIWNLVPDQAAAGDDQIRCKTYTTMNATAPTTGTGTWDLLQGEGTIVDPSDPKTKITDLAYGENIFRWTVTYGECSTEDDVVVYSNQADPYAGENDVTYNSYYQLNAGNPGRLTGYWTSLGTSTEISFADSSDYRTTVYGLSRGANTFRWTIETDDCLVYDEVTITYKVMPVAEFEADVSEGCIPLTVHFTDASTNATSYTWDFGDGTTSTVRSPSHTYQAAGTYLVKLSVPGPDDQVATYSEYITVYKNPDASFTASPQLVYLPDDKVYFINRSTDAETFEWQFGDGGTSTEKNPSYLYTNEGVYTVTLQVWSEHGCAADTTREDYIEARRGGFVVFPNVFAPREDATGSSSIFEVNATFRPVYQDVVTFHLQIYNRWGQLIFETDDINNGWDGRFNGNIAAEGVYVWIAKGKYVSGREFSKSGSVLLVK